MPHYLISGLRVVSDFPLSGVRAAPQFETEPEVHLCLGQVPTSLAQPLSRQPNWEVGDGDFLLRIPGVARLLVSAGSEIVLDAEHGVDDAMPFLLGTGFGALLHQRGMLALHAATVAYAGRAVALCGPSGVGKSTLSAALCQADCTFIGDDLAAIRFDGEGIPQVLPDSRSHRLWADAIERLALDGRRREAVRATVEKYHVEPEQAGEPLPLDTVVILRIAEFAGQTPSLVPLDTADAAALLRAEIYRPELARQMGRDAELFSQIARLMGRVRVFRLDRPQEPERMPEALALLKAHLFAQF